MEEGELEEGEAHLDMDDEERMEDDQGHQHSPEDHIAGAHDVPDYAAALRNPRGI